MNSLLICRACGTQFFPKVGPPLECPICLDDRQYIPMTGQAWTDLAELNNNYTVRIKQIRSGLYDLKMDPSFAIGQRALLLESLGGNLLWDCIPLINESTIEFIKEKGGLKAIAISHPHYYSTMNEWASIFNCPVYVHQNDKSWIQYMGPHIENWEGEEKFLWDDLKIIRMGGHFPGSCILFLPGTQEEGIILCGDTFYLSPSKKFISLMYSYPNHIPLPSNEIGRIRNLCRDLRFQSAYGAFEFQNLERGGKQLLNKSFEQL